MIPFNEAYKIVIDAGYTLGYERIALNGSLNRILAEDVFSDINMPPFNKSAMDGFACKIQDIKNTLEIIETIQAGNIPSKAIGKNQCSKIMTGAIIPDGADCVIKVENTFVIKDNHIKSTKDFSEKNICYKGEDIKEGDKVISKFTKIRPQHIAVLSSVGATMPLLVKLPRVGLICTGNEIVEPESKPGISQIRNSNGNQLIAQIKDTGAIPDYYGIVEDNKESIIEIINKAVSENDVIILTGGVSMGDYDFVPEVLTKIGFDILFDSIAVQPGKPTKFAVLDNKLCFGLPGNPVSCYIQFEFLVKPLLKKMMGEIFNSSLFPFKMGVDFSRKNIEREAFIPVKIINADTVIPLNYHGSAHINSFVDIFGLVSLGIGKSKINKGEIVNVRQV